MSVSSKNLRATTVATVLVILTIAGAQAATASVLTWNSTAAGQPMDGDGGWSSNANWWNSTGNVAWDNARGDTALFGAAAGGAARTVWLSGSQSVAGVTFQSQAYTLADGGGTLNLAGPSPVITVNASGGTIATAITGSASLTKEGNGLLALSGAGYYTGQTIVNGGTLQLNAGGGAAGALASPTVVVNSGGLLALNAQDALGYTSGREALAINGGTVANITPGSRVTLQNPFTMSGGVLTGSGSGDAYGVYSLDFSGGFTATSDGGGNPAIINAQSLALQKGDFVFNVMRGHGFPASDLTVAAAIIPFNGRNYGIIQTGDGVLTLTGSNTYTGGTTISGGTMVLGAGGSLPNSPSGTNTLVDNATLAFGRGNQVTQGTDFCAAAISGTGSLVQMGPGMLVLNAANTYTGPTVVSGGTLSANLLSDGGVASAIGRSGSDCANLVLQNGGVFQYTGPSVSVSRGLTVGAGGAAIDVGGGTLQLAGKLDLGGTLTKTGGGELRLTDYSGSVVSGGMFVISQGTVDLGSNCFGGSPLGYRALNIQVNPGADLNFSNAHALGGDNLDAGTSWGVVQLTGGTMSLGREQYISGGTVNSLGRLVLQGAAIINVGGGELRAAPTTSWISTRPSAVPSTIGVPMTAQYGPYVFDVADGPADADLLITGNISGSYGITKVNSGKLILTGSNSYATTTVSGGTLVVANRDAMATERI